MSAVVMAGSLWRQTIGSDEAAELTHAPGYDYQPDWSHDGRHIIFTRYQNDALELWQIDLQTGREVALTSHEPEDRPGSERPVTTAAVVAARPDGEPRVVRARQCDVL